MKTVKVSVTITAPRGSVVQATVVSKGHGPAITHSVAVGLTKDPETRDANGQYNPFHHIDDRLLDR